MAAEDIKNTIEHRVANLEKLKLVMLTAATVTAAIVSVVGWLFEKEIRSPIEEFAKQIPQLKAQITELNGVIAQQKSELTSLSNGLKTDFDAHASKVGSEQITRIRQEIPGPRFVLEFDGCASVKGHGYTFDGQVGVIWPKKVAQRTPFDPTSRMSTYAIDAARENQLIYMDLCEKGQAK